jgi:hypothetical protein
MRGNVNKNHCIVLFPFSGIHRLFWLLVPITITLSAAAIPAQEATRSDLAEFLLGCKARQSRFQNFHASGKLLSSTVTESVATSLGDLFRTTGNISRTAVDSLVDGFVARTQFRECYEYAIWVVGPGLVVDRVRDDHRDTTLEYLRSLGREPQPLAALVSERLFITDGGITIGIRDRETISRVEHFTRDQILNRLDCTLCDWSPIIKDEGHSNGLTREFRQNEPAPGQGTFIFHQDLSGGSSEVALVLDTTRGFIPISVRHTSAGLLQSAADFIYDPSDTAGFPAAILNRRMQTRGPDASVNVELFVFSSCESGEAVSLPELRVPALRNEVTSNQEGVLIIAREMPTEFRDAAPEDRLGLALAHILLHWGTTDPEFDLDGDGTVGVGDIKRAEAHF